MSFRSPPFNRKSVEACNANLKLLAELVKEHPGVRLSQLDKMLTGTTWKRPTICVSTLIQRNPKRLLAAGIRYKYGGSLWPEEKD